MRRGLARTALVVLGAATALLGAGLVPAPSAVAAPRSWGTQMSLEVTFYGGPDNDPPGGVIAHPVKHRLAGGTGTWSDPVTFAAAPGAFPYGTRIYYAPLRKYFVMEDDCAECIAEWASTRHRHVDLWAGYDAGVAACEYRLTPAPSAGSILVGPPSTEPATTTPIYAGGRCIR